MAVLIDYITATSNATVDFVKDGANFLEKLIDGATNLSKVRRSQIIQDRLLFGFGFYVSQMNILAEQ